MSASRKDPSHRSVPTGRRRRRAPEKQIHPSAIDLGSGRDAKNEVGAFLSVVVPAKNEAASLAQLLAETSRALRSLRNREGLRRLAGFEIIVVDDGSTDSTRFVLQKLAAQYPELKALELASGVGQSAATVAGIRAAKGTWIATLDADLQNDPADFVYLWDALCGYDAVLGTRVRRRDVWSKRVISYCANRVRNLILGQSVWDTGCSVRIFTRELALRLPVFHGMHRFFGPLLLREGCRLVQIPVRHRPRPYGRSHYNLWNRSFGVILDLLGVAWLTHRSVKYRVAQTHALWKAVDEKEPSVCARTVGTQNHLHTVGEN
jgi:dolichol-phosphate mannosyltransferase